MKLKEIKKLQLDRPQLDPKYDLLERFKCGHITIDGDPGEGKTSTVVALHIIHWFWHHEDIMNIHFYEVANKQANGFSELKPLDNLNYSTIDFDLSHGTPDKKKMYWRWFKELFIPKSKRSTNIIFKEGCLPYLRRKRTEYDLIRMPNDREPYMHFPYGAIISTSEQIDIENNNLANKDYDFNKAMFIKKRRHNGITLIDETQVMSRTTQWNKETITVHIHVAGHDYDYDNYGNIIRTKRRLWIYTGGKEMIEAGLKHLVPLAELTKTKLFKNAKLSANDMLIRSKIEVFDLVFEGNIHDYYDGEEHKQEFSFKLVNYEELPEIDTKTETKEAIEKRYELTIQERKRREQAAQKADIEEDYLYKQLKKEIEANIEAKNNTNNKSA